MEEKLFVLSSEMFFYCSHSFVFFIFALEQKFQIFPHLDNLSLIRDKTIRHHRPS